MTHYIHIYVCVCMCVCIYIYRERERDSATSAYVPLPCLRKDLRTGSISRDVVNCPCIRTSELRSGGLETQNRGAL